MCSIEEAWAGQNFENKRVSSQGDIHNAYMSLPNNLLNRNNEYTIGKFNEPKNHSFKKGINTKTIREQTVREQPVREQPIVSRNHQLQTYPTNSYGELDSTPSYMKIYNTNSSNSPNTTNTTNTNTTNTNTTTTNTNRYPLPTMTGSQFTDIESAYNISDTLDNFMNTTNYNNNSNMIKNNDLLSEDTDNDKMIINNKFNDKFDNIKKTQNKNNNDLDNTDIYRILNDIINKLDKIENKLHNNKRNIYDIILYIIIGMLISFIIYATLSAIKK
jgi:hypothetical protein